MTLLYLIVVMTLFSEWFAEGSGLVIFLNVTIIALTLLPLYFLRRIYSKIIFNDQNLILCSRFKLLNRKIKYKDILRILVDEKSSKRRIETKDEYFEIDDAKISILNTIANDKKIILKRVNVA